MQKSRPELYVLLSLSLVVAAFAAFWAFVSFFGIYPGYWSDQMLGFSAYAVGPVWILLALVTVHRHRKHGLWFCWDYLSHFPVQEFSRL
jgi:hypothetical protein